MSRLLSSTLLLSRRPRPRNTAPTIDIIETIDTIDTLTYARTAVEHGPTPKPNGHSALRTGKYPRIYPCPTLTNVNSKPQACENCSRSKCRCVARPGGPGCERCHRLNRPCMPSDSTRSLNAQRNNPVTRIAQLEGKLDGLVSLLQAGQLVTLPQSGHVLSPPHSNTSTPAVPASPASSSLAFEASAEEGDQCLSDFRSHMLKYFAIVDVSADAQWLRKERPFLFLCIMAVSSQSTQTKLALGERIKQTLAQRIILDNDPGVISIDLLLGLLTFLTWGHDHLLHDSAASLSRFTQLAMTLVFDLRLNKPLSDESNMLPVGSLAAGCAVPRGPARSMEERRAVLGCFVMSSMFVPAVPHSCTLRASEENF